MSLYCIPIMVIVFQMKSLMDQAFESLGLLGALTFSLNNTFRNKNYQQINNNSLFFREPPTSVFQLQFHSLQFLKVLPIYMLLLSSISDNKVLFIFSANKAAAEEVPLSVPLEQKVVKDVHRLNSTPTSSTSAQIDSS